MRHLQDTFGRKFPYIRLSIIDVCNFKCGYCLPNGYQKDKSDNRTFLNIDEIRRLAKGLSSLGVCKIRLTGGEPTVRKDFFQIVKILKNQSGIKKVVITTNGYRLNKISNEISKSGLDGINISIDSLNPKTFKTLMLSKKSFLAVGSPPVILILQTPNSEKHFARRLISSR